MKYQDIITVKKTNVIAEILFGVFIASSIFFSLDTQVSAFVSSYLDRNPRADFIFAEYTKENQAEISITNKKNVEKIFFNGVESRDKVTVSLEEGKNTFEFILSGNGKEVEKKVQITKDTKPPEFSTDFDFSDTKINSNVFSFTGELNEEGTVTINGNNCSEGEEIICELSISEKTDIVVLISDRAGNEVEENFTVDIDKDKPEIDIKVENPTYQEKVKITITSSEDLRDVTVGDLDADKKDSKTFTMEVTLEIGNNHFDITAKDIAGNETKKSITVERKEPTSGGGGYVPPGGGGGTTPTIPPVDKCSSVSLQLYNVKTPVFAGETQTASVLLKCSDGSGYAGQTVSISVRYANGTTRSYSATTNSSGIANFSFSVENISGNATITATYSFAQTSVTFSVT